MWKQYPYVEHSIQKIEGFVEKLFDIMFHALDHKSQRFVDVVDGDIKILLDKVKKYKIEGQLETLYEQFKKLNLEQIQILQTAFVNNNQIEQLCNKKVRPFRFKDLRIMYEKDKTWLDLLSLLKNFCADMYVEHINLKAFQDRYGTMDAYYKVLVKNDSMCHCCGIGRVLTENDKPRDSFDHYLPKGIYPFISLNFHNLIPTCPHCNSSYKNEIDTLFDNNGKTEKQVKAFLPFRLQDEQSNITVKVKLSKRYDPNHIKECGMLLDFSCKGKEEKLQTWLRIYKIEEQYTSYCYSQQILDIVNQMVVRGAANPTYLEQRILDMEQLNGVNGYFLQAAFARAVCESLGIKI